MLRSYIYAFLISAFFIASCEESALPILDESLPLDVDTLSLPIVKTLTYQIPPSLGDSEYLFFGKKDRFTFLYSLIRFDMISLEGRTFNYYNDSLVVSDSMYLVMELATDTIDYNSKFQLRYFPNSGDSVFNKFSTNNTNFSLNESSEVISSAGLTLENIDSSTTKVQLIFAIDSSIINILRDTLNSNINRTFSVQLTGSSSTELKFYGEKLGINTAPYLKVFFSAPLVSDSSLIDTFDTYLSLEELTVLEIPDITPSDTSYLSMGSASGLRSILIVDTEGLDLSSSIIRNAEVILHQVGIDTLVNYAIGSFPILSKPEMNSHRFYVEDPYEIDVTRGVSVSVLNNKLKLNFRSALTAFYKNEIVNHGFKLQSASTNDPFLTAYFYGINSENFNPYVRIIYVKQ